MSAEVKFVVYGVDDAGFRWRLPIEYPTFDEALVRAEYEEHYNPEVWVEKHTLYRNILWSISGPGLPDPALIPA